MNATTDTAVSSEATKDFAGKMITKAKKVTLTREQAEHIKTLPPHEAAAYRHEIANRSK